MIDDQQNGTPQPSTLEDEERSCRRSGNILDALDMEVAEDVEIVFERTVSHPRPATFD